MKFVFYDTETSGSDPRFDQALQFAAVVTDENFNELEAVNLRCRLLPHIVPTPDALLVTRVNPNDIAAAPLSHYEFATQIHGKMSGWGPAIYMGQNIIRFDEEVMRQTFWQNLLEPYLTTSRGSQRADLLNILQVATAIFPNCIATGVTENGNPSFKLDVIAPMNGFENHNAHDALGDVRASIYMARLVRERCPTVWDRMMANADPRKATTLIETNRMFFLVTHFGTPKIHQVTRCGAQPSNTKQVVSFDLANDPTPYLDMTAEQLAEVLESKDNPFRRFRTNAMPAVFEPSAGFTPTVEIDQALLIQRLDLIHGHPTFRDNMSKALELRAEKFETSEHVEDQIYAGFPSWDDKNRMQAFHRLPDWTARYAAQGQFQDKRLRNLALRLVFVNAPDVLPQSVRDAVMRAMVNDRLLTEADVPWTTVKTARACFEGKPETPELGIIRAWLDAFEANARETAARLAPPAPPAEPIGPAAA